MTITDAREHLDDAARDWLDNVHGTGSGPTFEVLDPGTGRILAELSAATESDVNHAVEAARAAFEDGRWSERDADHREEVLLRLAQLVERDFELLVTIEALDTGKPRAEAWYDIKEVIGVLRYYAGWCTKATGTTIPAPRQYFAVTLRGPVGVCAAITPWNYPLPILMYKLAPALAFGNSFIAKPSELAPLSALHFVRLCAEAGVPDDVVTVLTGAGSTGAALAAHPGLDKMSLELGGKSPNIVFASADLEAAADGVALGIWTNAGQVCVAGSRLLVERSIHDRFVDLLAERTDAMVLGHSLDPEAQIGPMISAAGLTC